MRYRLRRIKRFLLNHIEAVGVIYITVSDALLLFAFIIAIKYNIFNVYEKQLLSWIVFAIIAILNMAIERLILKALDHAKDKMRGDIW